MTIKYQIRCTESDIYVLEKDDGFYLTIGSRVNPLSFGNKLADYNSLEKAIEAADKFCEVYALTKEFGYHLQSTEFHKEGMKSFSVPKLLDSDLTQEAMRELLESEASLHGTI
jgi:hypothetical protein